VATTFPVTGFGDPRLLMQRQAVCGGGGGGGGGAPPPPPNKTTKDLRALKKAHTISTPMTP